MLVLLPDILSDQIMALSCTKPADLCGKLDAETWSRDGNYFIVRSGL